MGQHTRIRGASTQPPRRPLLRDKRASPLSLAGLLQHPRRRRHISTRRVEALASAPCLVASGLAPAHHRAMPFCKVFELWHRAPLRPRRGPRYTEAAADKGIRSSIADRTHLVSTASWWRCLRASSPRRARHVVPLQQRTLGAPSLHPNVPRPF